MLLRPQRVASYALVLWAIIKPLGVVETIQLVEDNTFQAMPTIGLNGTSVIPSIENSDINITLLEIAPVMDNIVKDTTDKATGITQSSEVCFYKDKPLAPPWITDNPFGNICVSPGLTNVTFTSVSAPPTHALLPLPPQTTEFQFSSVLSTVIRLLKYLELGSGGQSACVCKGNSETDPIRMLFQMTMKLLVSSLIQRLYITILKQLRRTIFDRLKCFSRTTDEHKFAIGGNTIISLHPRMLYDFFRGFWATVGWRRSDIITAIRSKHASGLVIGLSRIAEGKLVPTAALDGGNNTQKGTRTNDINRLEQNFSALHFRESNMTRLSMDRKGYQETDSAATMEICEDADINTSCDTIARPASLCAPSGDDQSCEFDVPSPDQGDSVDAWFEMNMSKEIPPIKVQPFDDDNETRNYLSTDNMDEQESDEQLITDPMECKPIGHRYPRSENTQQTGIIESSNSQEARDYVAKRCPFLFEDLETPPPTPTLPDTESSSSDDGDGQWETEYADLTAVKVGSGRKALGIQDTTTMNSNASKPAEEIATQLAATAFVSTDSSEQDNTSSAMALGGTTSIIQELSNSTTVHVVTTQHATNVASPTDSNENGHSNLTVDSDTTQTTTSRVDSDESIATGESSMVANHAAPCQESLPLELQKSVDSADDANATTSSGPATLLTKGSRSRKSNNQDSRTRLLEDAVSISLVRPVDVWLSTYLEPELANIDVLFEAKGSTGNWQRREGLIMHLRGMLKGYTFGTFTKELASGLAKNRRLEKTLNALSSSRQTTVCLAANYYSELAQHIGTDFDPFVKIVLPPLLRLSGSSHQALVTCTQMALQVIIVHGIRNSRSALSILLRDYTNETNPQIRQHTIKHLMTMLRAYGSGTSLKTLRVSSSDVVAVALKAALGDADIEVRKAARLCYWEFAEIWSKAALDIRSKMSKRAKELLDRSNLERSISDLIPKCAIECPNVVVTEVDGEEVEPCCLEIWNGNKSYPPEAFSGVAPLIDPRYLSPFVA